MQQLGLIISVHGAAQSGVRLGGGKGHQGVTNDGRISINISSSTIVRFLSNLNQCQDIGGSQLFEDRTVAE